MVKLYSAKATLFALILLLLSGISYSQNDVISLTVQDANSHQDQTAIYFNSGATTAFDGAFDALKMFSSNPAVPNLFSVSSDSIALSINGLPPFNSGTTVPVYLTSTQNTNYTLSANLAQCNPNWDVVVLDSTTLNSQDLRTGNYSFSHNPANSAKRFFLQINCDVEWNQGGAVCMNSGLINLNSPSITGGVFSGPGIVSGSGVFDPLLAGPGVHIITYSVQIGNCTAIDTSMLEVLSTPVIDLPSDTLAISGSALALDYSISGGSGNYAISWNSPVAFSDLSGLTTQILQQNTLLIATITDLSTGCVALDSVNVQVVNPLQVTFSTDQNAICEGDTVIGQIGVSGGSGSQTVVITPSPQATSGSEYTFTPIQTTLYTYTVDDGFQNVSGSFTIQVNPIPTIQINAPTSICNHIDETVITATPAGGVFSGAGMTSQGVIDATSLSAGVETYYYQYISSFGCVAIDSFTIAIFQSPTLDLPQSTVIPNGAFTTLSIPNPEPGVNYTWEPAALLNTASGTSVTTLSLSSSTTFYATATNILNGCAVVDSILVSVTGTPLMADITVSDFSICEGDSAQVNAIISGGTGNYSIQWSPAGVFSSPISSSTTISPSQTGKIYLQVNDGFNTVIDSVTIQVFPEVQVSWNGNLNRCINSGNVQLTGGLPTGGVYSGPGVQNGVFNPIQAGVGVHELTYSYTTSNGCTYSETKEVEVFPAPQAFLPSLGTICVNAATINLSTGIPTGGVYSGSGVVNGSQFNPSLAGVGQHVIVYTYTSSEGCVTNASAIINVTPPPSVSLAQFGVVCSPDEPVFALSGGLPLGGVYSGNGVQNGTFNPSIGPGTYAIAYTVDAGTGCTSSATRNITVLPKLSVNAPADFNIPFGTNTSLPTTVSNGSGFYSYQWSPSDSLINSTSSSPSTINLRTTNTFVVQITDLQTGCTATDSVRINVLGSPLSVDSIGDFIVCDGDSLIITPVVSGGSGNYNFYWTPSTDILNPLDSQVVIVPTANRQVTLTVGDGFNFVSTTFQIELNNAVAADAGTYSPICISAPNLPLSGTPSGGTFQGLGVVNGNAFSPLLAGLGDHWVYYQVNQPGGCVATDSTLISVVPESFISLQLPDTLCLGESIELGDIGSFTGIDVLGSNFVPTSAGQYIISHFQSENGCTDTTEYSITVTTAPAVTLPIISTLCTNDSPVELLGASPSGGNYSGPGVSNGFFDPSIGAGVYPIVYTLNNGFCTVHDTLQITVNALPAPQWNLPNQVCISGSAIPLSANGIITGTGVLGNTFDPSIAGLGWHVLSLSVSNAYCTAVFLDSIFVFDSAVQPTITSPDSVCEGSMPIALSSDVSGGTWFGNGVSGGYFYPSLPGNYAIQYVVNSSNGCSDTAQQIITVSSAQNVSSGVPTTMCINDLPISLNNNGNTGYWTGSGVANNTFNPLTSGPGTHVLTFVSTGENCISTSRDTVEVFAAPMVDLGADFSVNNGQAVSINAAVSGGSGMYQYQWSPQSSILTNNQSNIISIALLQTTTFSVTVTDMISGCVSTDQVVVSVLFDPITANVTVSDHVICEGDSVVINVNAQGGTGNYTITYSPNSNLSPSSGSSVTATPASSQTYTITVTDGVQTISHVVSIQVLPIPNAQLTLATTICAEASPINLTGGSPNGGNYFGNGVANGKFFPSIAGVGNHTVFYTVQNALGCSDTASASIEVLPLPNTPVIVRNADVLSTASGQSAYQWYWNGVLLPNSNSNSITITQSGVYTVRVTDNAGCSNTSSPFDVLFVGNEEFFMDFKIFPNPATNLVHVSSSELIQHIQIIDITGRTLVRLEGNSKEMQLELSHLTSGIYTIWMQTENGYSQQKLIIQK